jgi:uncharacterized protein DUF1565
VSRAPFAALLFAGLSVPLAALAQDRYVDAVIGSDLLGDGSPAKPWRSITFSLAQMFDPGMHLHVEPGVYDESIGETFPIVLKSNVDVLGSDAPSTIVRETLSQAIVVTLAPTPGRNAIRIEGLTITRAGGGGPTTGLLLASADVLDIVVSECIVDGLDLGVSVQVGDGHPVIRHCVIRNGGTGILVSAIANEGAGLAAPEIASNVVTGNASTGISIVASPGGELHPLVVDDTVSRNGEGIRLFAGGIVDGHCAPSRIESVLDRNRVLDGTAAGIVVSADEGAVVRTVVSNSLVAANGTGIAIAANSETCSSTFEQSTDVVCCTIADNRGAGVSQTSAGPLATPSTTIEGSIVDGNGDDLADAVPIAVRFSDVGDGSAGPANGNIAAPPLFVGRAIRDYRLAPTSPCIDVGTAVLPAGLPLPGFDLAGNPRDFDGDRDGVRQVDMGALEFAPLAGACRYGTVDVAASFARDVVFVNGTAGDAFRNVAIPAGSPFRIEVLAPPGGPAPARFALLVFVGVPDAGDLSPQPGALGTFAFPTPLTGGSPRVLVMFDNLAPAARARIGEGRRPSSPAPFEIAIRGGVARAGRDFTLQGIVANTASQNGRYAVTNAVVVRVP